MAKRGCKGIVESQRRLTPIYETATLNALRETERTFPSNDVIAFSIAVGDGTDSIINYHLQLCRHKYSSLLEVAMCSNICGWIP